MRRIYQLTAGLFVALAAFVGVAVLSPADSSPFAAQTAHACTHYYQVNVNSAGIRATPQDPPFTYVYRGQVLYSNGWVVGNYTYVWFNRTNVSGTVSGWILNTSRTQNFQGCV